MKVATTIAGWCFQCEVAVYRDALGYDVGVPGLLVVGPNAEDHDCGYTMRCTVWSLTHRRSGFAVGFAQNPEQAAAIAHDVRHLNWSLSGEELAHNAPFIEAVRSAVHAHGGEMGMGHYGGEPVDVNP